ncbi:MAG: glycosyltransferase family 9 protein [Vampirovibrionales bacterium]
MAHRRFTPSSNAPRILIAPLRFVGDMVLSLPLVEGLRWAYPNAHIGVLASPLNAPLAQHYPGVDSVVIEAPHLSARWRQLAGWEALISCRQSWTLPLLAKLAGVGFVSGFDRQRFPLSQLGERGFCRSGWLLDAVAPYPPTALTSRPPHQVVAQWELLTPFWPNLSQPPPPPSALHGQPTTSLPQPLTDLLDALPTGQKRVLFHAFSGSGSKALPLETFLPACQALIDQGFSLIATGVHHDRPALEAFAKKLQAPKPSAPVPFVISAGHTQLGHLATLASQCQGFLGVDSGPVHVAAACGITRFVVAYGPTHPLQWGPYGVDITLAPVHYPVHCSPNTSIEELPLKLKDAALATLV